MPCRAFEDQIELVAASVEPVPFGPGAESLATYPLPLLRPAGGEARTTVPLVVLENEWTRASIAPSLGGRVLALFDKRTGSHVIPAPSRIEASRCGARGLWLQHGAQASLDPERDSMAPFNHLVYTPQSEEGPAAVLLYSLAPGTGLGLQVCFTLSDEDPALLVEARAFNRTLGHRPFRLSLSIGGAQSDPSHRTIALAPLSLLAPRDTVAFRLRLEPPFAPQPGGTTLEAEPAQWQESAADPASLPLQLRGAAYIALANRAGRGGDLKAALGHVDSALATLGDDPLAWWQRAVLARLAGEADDEREDLTMAHALSPLEPALRAEAFLSMPQGRSKDPSAVLSPLAGDPDALHEAAHLLVEAGLFQEAARLIDEAQRHGEHPLLRYLYAWCLLQATRMDVEAAAEVGKASRAPIGPPFPWRETEVRAVSELAAKFPADARLQTLNGVLVKRSGPAN